MARRSERFQRLRFGPSCRSRIAPATDTLKRPQPCPVPGPFLFTVRHSVASCGVRFVDLMSVAHSQERGTTPSGTVKWFNATKGLRFHAARRRWRQGRFRPHSAVENAGFRSLAEGAKVTFDGVPNKGKESAENLRVA
jgi:cold shock protein